MNKLGWRLLAVLALMLMLAGCAVSKEPVGPESPGLFEHFIVYPFSWVIGLLADVTGGSYGLAIILATLIVRLAIMPLMLNQYKKQAAMRAKMAVMQPELKQLQEKYKGNKTADAMQAQQREMLELYQKHQYNPLNIGCLPMLLQLPIVIGFYHAIQRTPEIAQHTFLWFDLGHPDMVLPLLAGAVYFIQFKVSQTGMDSQAMKQMAWIGWISPIAMAAFSFAAPAALPLYWTIGGLFLIGQTLLAKRLYRTPEAADGKRLPEAATE